MQLLSHHCSGDHASPSRREFLGTTLGSVLGALLWPHRLLALEQRPGRDLARSIIILWLKGGPSHIDSFDPKTGNDAAGLYESIPTALPGLRFTDRLPQTADVADRLAVIRSLSHTETNHFRARYFMKTGYEREAAVMHPVLGSHISKELGDPAEALSPFITINDLSVGPGFLGDAYSPFHVARAGDPVENLAPPSGVDADRFVRRLDLREKLEVASPLGGLRSPGVEGYRALRQRAVALMHAPQIRAFDLEQEPEALRAAYGMNPFGQGCLLARRLVEQGVRCVEVTLDGWDTHEDNFTHNDRNLGQFDPGFATLIRDLEQRKMLDSTLVLAMGEFGRTPEISSDREGRGHHPHALFAVLAGGGLRTGQLIGATDERGDRVVKDRLAIPDLILTLCLRLGLDPDRTNRTPRGRVVPVVKDGRPIEKLLRV